jgi:hypothetical protein
VLSNPGSKPLTPFRVARSQLLAAIDLFFEDRDPVSVQVLAGNARELLESLCRFREIEPMTELLLRDHPDHAKKDSRFEALTRREQEVFGVLGHEAAEAPHGLRNAFLVGRDDLAEVFWVHAG